MFGVKHIKLSFFLDLFFKEKSFPGFYNKISNTFSNSIIFSKENEEVSHINTSKNIYSIFDIPSYFSLEISKKQTKLKTLKVPLYKGFLINLNNYSDLNNYLRVKLGKKRRSQLKRHKIRLDLCIAPNYKIYYGDISKNECNYIFDTLKGFMVKRFEQKEEVNFELPYLEIYKKMMYQLILQKKASIFVIYHEQKPINIALNFIENELLLHWYSCYDTNYQMFNLGHVNVVNHLEWCFNNGIKIFDMGRGDFSHKRKYITDSYNYQEHITYNSASIKTALLAFYKFFILKLRFVLIKGLKKINAQVLYSKYAKFKYKTSSSKKESNPINNVIQTPINDLPSNLNLITINDIPPTIIKSLNYFLYYNKESIHDVKIYKNEKSKSTLYFVGKTKKVKLSE